MFLEGRGVYQQDLQLQALKEITTIWEHVTPTAEKQTHLHCCAL